MADAADPILLPVSLAQVRDLMLGLASRQSGTGPLRLLFALTGNGGGPLKLSDFEGDGRYESSDISQALIHALSVLSAFGNGQERGVRELGREVGMTSPTAGRYMRTWAAVGVLEQDPRTHRYRPTPDWSQPAIQPARR